VRAHLPAEPVVFTEHELAGRLERGRDEIGRAGLGHGAHECGTAARCLTREDVALGVPDHPGAPEIDVELSGEMKNHSGARLPARAVRCHIVRAVREGLDAAAVLGETVLDDQLEGA
jgi:hypothetical protein